MIPSSTTVATAATEIKRVKIANLPAEEVVTHSDGDQFSGIAVRATKEQIVLRFEPNALEEQRRTEELNERIRKYGKAF
jgi:hypothetical protein